MDPSVQLWSLGLVAVRLWGVLVMQVLWRSALGGLWLPVAAGLALVLAPSVGTVVAVPGDPIVAIGSEAILGLVIGAVVTVPGYALVGSADVAAWLVTGPKHAWRRLVVSFVGATVLALGLHHPLLLALDDLWRVFPTGEPARWLEGLRMVSAAQLAHGLALLALTFATPALLVAAVAELAVRVVAGRVAPGPTLAAVLAPAVKLAAVLVATGASWAAYDATWAAGAL